MNESKRQTLAMIGIVFLVVSGILMYAGLSQPRVYEQSESTGQSTAAVSDTSTLAVSDTSAAEEKPSEEVSNNPGVSYPINLNTATYDELVTIEGIGDVRAKQILQYRDAIGGYSSVEQIKEISGIGDALYNQVSPYLTV